MDEYLRKQVKYLKVFQNIRYKEIAEYLEMNIGSFYNWLRGNYNFSEDKITALNTIINNLKEE